MLCFQTAAPSPSVAGVARQEAEGPGHVAVDAAAEWTGDGKFSQSVSQISCAFAPPAERKVPSAFRKTSPKVPPLRRVGMVYLETRNFQNRAGGGGSFTFTEFFNRGKVFSVSSYEFDIQVTFSRL